MGTEQEGGRFGEDTSMTKILSLSTKSFVCRWQTQDPTPMEVSFSLPRLKLPGLMEDMLSLER